MVTRQHLRDSHCGSVKTSKILQRVRDYLISKGNLGATTREMIRNCDVCAVNSIIDSLRTNGYTIRCKNEGVTLAGVAVFRYTLTNPKHRT